MWYPIVCKRLLYRIYQHLKILQIPEVFDIDLGRSILPILHLQFFFAENDGFRQLLFLSKNKKVIVSANAVFLEKDIHFQSNIKYIFRTIKLISCSEFESLFQILKYIQDVILHLSKLCYL